MDHFGIGSAIRATVGMYCASARGTGRTTSLVDSVKDGDRVVFVNRHQERHFSRLCAERGVDVETFICDPRTPEKLFDRGSVSDDGRLIFDHVWVEEYYRLAIERAGNDIDKFQQQIGGYGAAHRETSRAAREWAKFASFDLPNFPKD